MNFVHISISIHFVWLTWLSLQFYDHDITIAKIVGSVLPNGDIIEAHSSVLEHNTVRLQPRSESTITSSTDIPNFSSENPTRNKNHIHTNNPKKEINNRVPLSFPSFLSGEVAAPGEPLKSESHPNRKTIQVQTSDGINTKCVLKSFDNSTFFIHTTFDYEHNITSDSSITFDLSLDLTTDRKPWETSWTLSPRGNDTKIIVNSQKDGQTVELLPETTYRMVYSCVVSSPEEDELDKSNICYDFNMQDLRYDGMCCTSEVGSFLLRLNDVKDPIYSGRFHVHYKKVSFCLGDNSNVSEEDDDDSKLYPSKECLHDKCMCNSKPNLLSNFDDIESKYPGLHELKTRIMMNILILSGSEYLRDINSPQYMAACWTLNDDPYLTQYSNTTAVRASDAEKRMMQRYILAVLYYSNNPQNWVDNQSFLSSKSECDWNNDLFSFTPPISNGVRCDDRDNVICVMSYRNNLEGNMIDEISGLKSLEYLVFYADKTQGTIPPSIGRLSELQFFALPDLDLLEGTLPPELFNAKKLQYINIRGTKIVGTIPQAIGNLQGLQYLDLSRNHDLTGSIPEELFSLTELIYLYINDNMLSSTISSSIGNLQQLERFRAFNNTFTGPLPSQLGSLSELRQLNLMTNNFSGTIPSSFKSLFSAEQIDLFETDLKGEVPDELCEIDPRPAITADCRNDIFSPELMCSCCSYCADKTPVWDGICPDVQLKFNIDHVTGGQWFSSELLQWSITDTATNSKIIADGPYTRGVTLKPSYETCVASSHCLVLNMRAEPLIEKQWNADIQTMIEFKTNYSIYWNDKLVLEDVFELDVFNLKVLPEVTFQYDALTDEIQVGSSCAMKEITCGGETLVLNPVQRVMYNTAFKVSGTAVFDDFDSHHSKALCWIIKDDSLNDNKDISEIETLFSQRYVLALLHQASESGLFGSGDLPPPSHECSWEGITCADGKDKMTSLLLSSSANQIIGGTLIEEIGNFAFLEILHLDQTGLKGTIPSVFSNLYSLRELNCSGNALTGSIPDDFFDQLGRLELFDLSDNDMSGTIPASIGSHSDIEVIQLSGNRFTGELPLGNFTRYSLKQLDLSKNELSGSISPSLLKHKDLEYLDLGRNFFVGSIEESIFDDLVKLKHFDVSQNELMGVIPPLNHNVSNTIFFDMHANRITGTLPVSLVGMTTLKYLNLQGNEITGSIPSELNSLEGLHTLLLSHNKLKGSIPLSFDKLTNMNILHLQSNQLSGKAPITDKGMGAYVTDCGYPSVALNPVDCPSCNICCNADDQCARQRKSMLRPTLIAVIVFVILIGFMTVIYAFKQKIASSGSIFENHVMYWKASSMIGDKSVYHFFLTQSTQGWYVGLFCAVAQLATLFLFINAADIANEGSDLQYTITCSRNSLECEDEKSRSIFGGLIFTLILAVWLLKDIVDSIKLFMVAMWKKDIDFFFASMIIFLVSSLSIWTSVYYNLAIATKDTELIVNAVILLFVNELDERLYQLVKTCHFSWTDDVDESLLRDSFHDDQKLNVFRAVNKVKKRFLSLGSPSSSRRRSADLNNPAVDQENLDVSNIEYDDPEPMNLDSDPEEENN